MKGRKEREERKEKREKKKEQKLLIELQKQQELHFSQYKRGVEKAVTLNDILKAKGRLLTLLLKELPYKKSLNNYKVIKEHKKLFLNTVKNYYIEGKITKEEIAPEGVKKALLTAIITTQENYTLMIKDYSEEGAKIKVPYNKRTYFIINYMLWLPLSNTNCCYCLYHNPDNFDKESCKVCNYGKNYGFCTETYSSYINITRAKQLFLDSVQKYYKG